MSGTLYLVATPIGNLGDITLRAIETLRTVDAVACEDTRRTEKLMRHLQILKPLLRYDEHTHAQSSKRILDQIKAGKSVALVSDAGTPAVSDPGARLVREAVQVGVKIVPIPGPSSVVSAFSASGFLSDGFVFLGFLPRRPGRARRLLQEALGLGRTVVVFESPFRVSATLLYVADLRPDAEVLVARELTKIHEEFVRGNVQHIKNIFKERPPKGEIVILIQPEREPQKSHDNQQEQ